MRLLLLTALLAMTLYSDVKREMLDLFQNRDYKEACSLGFKNFSKHSRDEEFVSLYGFSCLNVDYVDRLSVPITTLKLTPESRANAAYFSIILMQKKLLYHALLDNYDISSLNLPTTDYVLSKVFDFYIQQGKHEPKEFYVFEDEDDKNIKYKLYILKDGKIDKMVIEEFYNSISTKKHMYW